MQKLMAFVGLILALALLTINLPHITNANANEQVDVYDQQKKLVKSVVFALGAKEYFVNNQTPGVRMDVAPFIENGRTFVPVRFLSNALGVVDDNIGWDEKARLVTLAEPGFPKVELVIGSRTIESNGQPKQMDVAPVIKDRRTFLPARFVAEALGYQVDWDAANQVVICWPKGMEKPDIDKVMEHIEVAPVEPEPAERDFSTAGDGTKFVPQGNILDKWDFGQFNSSASFSEGVYKIITVNDLPHEVGWTTIYSIERTTDRFDRDAIKVKQHAPYGNMITKLQVTRGNDVIGSHSTAPFGVDPNITHVYGFQGINMPLDTAEYIWFGQNLNNKTEWLIVENPFRRFVTASE